MKTTAGSIKKGNFISINKDIFTIVKIEHSHVGRGSANLRMKCKNVRTGNSVEKTFGPDNSVEVLDVDTIQMQFLYKSDQALTFMDGQTYEQVEIDAKVVGNFAQYLKEGQLVYVLMHDEEALAIRPPSSVKLKVIEAQDAAKGNTATNARKPVKLESGTTVNVPIFIKKGETIVINPETGEYIERA